MNNVLCAWCGVGKGEINHHVSYEPEIINRICKKCHFLYHKKALIPCQKCKGSGKVRYHTVNKKMCVSCDPDPIRRAVSMLWENALRGS